MFSVWCVVCGVLLDLQVCVAWVVAFESLFLCAWVIVGVIGVSSSRQCCRQCVFLCVFGFGGVMLCVLVVISFIGWCGSLFLTRHWGRHDEAIYVGCHFVKGYCFYDYGW